MSASMDQDEQGPSVFQARSHAFFQRYQSLLDRTTPHVGARWGATALLLVLFLLRVLLSQGWYIVTYALGIYLLNLFLAFLQPKYLDPPPGSHGVADLENLEKVEGEMSSLPTRNDEEFRPFIRRLPEFKFWHSATRAIIISMICTLFEFLDIPVFWPILLIYFCILFAITMKRQIRHMIRYKYVPFDLGKKTYAK
ncbi:MAG: retrieval of early ER protein Rer1 [Piptocephalis tieghemiana]|nr:MAG: retrieval of early ER protein Rer1 [Piptocephalis tieghemiana]